MPAAAIAIPAAMKIGTSLLGGLQARSATNDAVSALLSSFTGAGNTAQAAVDKVNPEILGSAKVWGDNVMNAGEAAASDVTNAAGAGQQAVTGAVKEGQGMMQPYQQAGTGALETLSKLLQKPDQFNFKADPGYQFRLNEGMKAVSRMAAAHGAAGGGGTAKAAAQYSSGLASQEYNNGWQRWNAEKTQRQGGLATLAGMGERAGEFSSDLGIRGSQFNANLGLGAAEYGGSMRAGTTQWAGTQGINAVDKTSSNSLDLANFLANLQINAGKATAAGDISKGNMWSTLLPQLGQMGADVYTGIKNLPKK